MKKWGKDSAASGTSKSASAARATAASNSKRSSAGTQEIANDSRSNEGRRATDPVNPSHYQGDYVMRIAEDFGLDKDACLFQVLKYILRGGKKANNPLEDDLKKAGWYLARRISQLKAGK